MPCKPLIARSILLATLLAAVHVQPVHAQLEELRGRRVRVSLQPWPGAIVSQEAGVLTTVAADSLTISSDGLVRSIPRSHVTDLDVSTGIRRQTGRGALIGFAVGALAFGALSAITDDPNPCEPGAWFCFEFTTGEAFVIGAVPGGLLGAGIGALAGYISQVDRWESVELQLATLPGTHGAGVPSPGIRIAKRF